ncbi:hypothetical protein NHX12_028533 [Muraenolepis orangiensis]|uniref:Uncharacterized protein n=1 Tax=Muraenolepis orangiensis TaxID=630683 RepID=A0A9Q0IKE3_9TELE|nr:hypothetical protein NHX12_028533 [Muraenolepis orangiensis]
MGRIVKHEEADVTLISYMLEAARAGAIRILIEDTVVFVLLVYWAWKANVESAVQKKEWTYMPPSGHWVTHVRVSWECMRCQDVTLSPCGKGKASPLKVLPGSTMHCLDTVLGEPDATHSDLKDTGTSYSLHCMGRRKTRR